MRKYDECQGWAKPGMRSCAHWLNWKCGIGIDAAREKVRVALAQENDRHEMRKLILYSVDGGQFVLHGQLTAEQGALLKKVLDAVMDEDFEEQKDVPAETPADEKNPRPRWIGSRRADALVRIAQSYLANSVKDSNGGDRYLVHVHTDIETLKADGTGAEAEIEECGHVPAETARRMSCDAGVIHWLEHDGEPLSIGRKTRSIPPAIRRALKRRDDGCRFPGCTCTRFVDAHHIRHWADGGDTSMDNLALLCRHHHRLVHEGGFRVERDAAGQLQFIKPDGKVLPESGETRSRGNALALFTTHAEAGIHITAKTTITKWCGEHMDDQMAVGGLLYRETIQK